jgi:uncharacterized protein (DUF433 family)
MPSMKTKYEHIVLENSVPVIAGTTMKVIELVVERMAYGWSPEELHFQHSHLSLGQIHSALAYYWDHTSKLDQDLEHRLQFIAQARQSSSPSPLLAKLKSKDLI